jgi:hypothetical protein
MLGQLTVFKHKLLRNSATCEFTNILHHLIHHQNHCQSFQTLGSSFVQGQPKASLDEPQASEKQESAKNVSEEEQQLQ